MAISRLMIPPVAAAKICRNFSNLTCFLDKNELKYYHHFEESGQYPGGIICPDII
jgi:hypothetical protein